MAYVYNEGFPYLNDIFHVKVRQYAPFDFLSVRFLGWLKTGYWLPAAKYVILMETLKMLL